MSGFTGILQRDLRIGLRRPGQLLYAPACYILIALIFPLALGPAPETLRNTAPGLLVTAALLASLLPLERLFRDDRDDGTLDVLMTREQPFALYVAARITSHWIMTGLLLLLLTPLLVPMLILPGSFIMPALIILLPVTLALTLIGTLATALAMGARQGSLLLALLSLPLYIPVLIFGAGGLSLAVTDKAITAPLLFLWAIVAAALPLVPLLTAAILKGQQE